MIDEGTIKFESTWQESAPLSAAETGELICWRAPLFRAGMIGHCAEHDVGYGNLSARVGNSRQFIISGTQTGHVADVSAEHFALVTDYDIDGNAVTSTGPVEASSESLTHAAIYELDPATRAVVHVHNERLWVALRDRLPSTRDTVAYGTPRMAREFARLRDETSFAADGVALMAGHQGGLISFGSSVREAAERMLALTVHADD